MFLVGIRVYSRGKPLPVFFTSDFILYLCDFKTFPVVPFVKSPLVRSDVLSLQESRASLAGNRDERLPV